MLHAQVRHRPAQQAVAQLRRAISPEQHAVASPGSPPAGHPDAVQSASSPDTAMEDADASVPGSAAARDSMDQPGLSNDARSASLPVSDLSPPRAELQEDSFVCHICLVRSGPINADDRPCILKLEF